MNKDMDTEGSPHSSLCMVRAEELFPKSVLEKDDPELTVPLTELAGESFRYLGGTVDGVLALSNYRLYLKSSNGSEISVPLGLIDHAHVRDLNQIIISCKDASTVKCSFETPEMCNEWQRRISLHTGCPPNLETLFAFPFYTWSSENKPVDSEWAERLQRAPKFDEDFEKERIRLKFKLNTEGGPWRISKVNAEFKLCPSYPRNLIVPACIDDADLLNVATFRSSRRIPAVVWRHKTSGAIMARCSQPELGWLGWRNANDEEMLKAFVEACENDRLEIMRSKGLDLPKAAVTEGEEIDDSRKLLIVDARSYASAVTNRARGGGCECTEYYRHADIDFMNLGNIHTIRKSFQQLRQLCASPPDNHNWLSSLERSVWLQHLASLLSASVTVCRTIELCGRPVLVHCSDGWDRTPQILATSQLCLDPFYRTVDGFRTLVEREWLGFGHKFADRCGHGPGAEEVNERCPVFLQWLDVVHQIHRQFPCSFEFSMGYLIKLAQHSHSCLFGTFLCNTLKDRVDNSVLDRTFSVWTFLSEPIYKNPLYVPNRERVLWPAQHVRDLVLWSEVYLNSLGNQNMSDYPRTDPIDPTKKSPLTKTRSYNDLQKAAAGFNGHLPRRSSDPNMSGESNFVETPSGDDPSIDINGQLDEHSQEVAELCSDTCRVLDGLTAELAQSDQTEFDVQNQPNEPNENVILGDDAPDRHATCDIFNGDSNSVKNEDSNRLLVNRNRGPSEMIEVSLGPDVVDGPTMTQCADGSNIEHNHYDGLLETCNNGIYQYSTEPLSLAADHNLLLSTVDASCSDAVFPHTQYTRTTNGLNSIDTTNGHSSGTQGIETIDQYTSHSTSNVMNGNRSVDRPLTSTDSKSSSNGESIASTTSILPLVHSASTNGNNNHSNNNHLHRITRAPPSVVQQQPYLSSAASMDESIVIRPEFQRMEITNGGHISGAVAHPMRKEFSGARAMSAGDHQPMTGDSVSPTSNAHFFSPGARSLPLTPPALHERSSVAISCPDGLAHALSEQNLRLQQIVHEHKIREDALTRELYSTRLALMQRLPQAVHNQPGVDDAGDVLNDDDFRVAHSECSSIGRCSQSPPWPVWNRESHYNSVNALLDNAENASVCSWEAVEEQRGYSISGGGSSNGSTNLSSSVLWVPDHAVSQCTSCQTEFWLGRRKHHCRSCGQIFCADCSEFWAALPDERLYQPVRLCGPCYHNVTTKSQWQQKPPNPNKFDRPTREPTPEHFSNSCCQPSRSSVGSATSNSGASMIPVATPAMNLVRQHKQQLQLLQQQQQQLQQHNEIQPCALSNAKFHNHATVNTNSVVHHPNNTSIEPCKPATGSSANDIGTLQAATATN